MAPYFSSIKMLMVLVNPCYANCQHVHSCSFFHDYDGLDGAESSRSVPRKIFGDCWESKPWRQL